MNERKVGTESRGELAQAGCFFFFQPLSLSLEFDDFEIDATAEPMNNKNINENRYKFIPSITCQMMFRTMI